MDIRSELLGCNPFRSKHSVNCFSLMQTICTSSKDFKHCTRTFALAFPTCNLRAIGISNALANTFLVARYLRDALKAIEP